MARDRQRAKQRRRRQAGSTAGPGARARSARAREIGLDEGGVEDAGLGAAPDPLAHSSADVDEARLAEAGIDPPDVGEELHAPDEVEDRPEAVAAGVRGETALERPRRRRGGVLGFLGACIDELRRVQWPDRRQVAQGTAVVLGFVVIAGGYLGLLDAIWKPLIQAIL
jgi:preprotein translocase SecE subunit